MCTEGKLYNHNMSVQKSIFGDVEACMSTGRPFYALDKIMATTK